MAKPEKEKFSVLREGTQFGDASSVELTAGQAEAFIRAGDIAPFDASLEPAKSKTAARGKKTSARSDPSAGARIKQLEAELAAAVAKGGDPKALEDAIARADKAEAELQASVPIAQLKSVQDEKAALETELASARANADEFQAQISALAIRVTEAEELANEAALETESLDRVIAVIAETAPELVTQAKETVAAEYQATSDAQAQPPADEAG